MSNSPCTPLQFQPTRPREARRINLATKQIIPYVSTHAPTGGATNIRAQIKFRFNVSTHAPTGGATGYWQCCAMGRIVSTHAPTGGATSGSRTGIVMLPGFNPRAHGRRDPAARW